MSINNSGKNQPSKPSAQIPATGKATPTATSSSPRQQPIETASALQRGAQAGAQAGPFEDVDLRDEADDPDYTFIHGDSKSHSAYPGQADHPRKYAHLTEEEAEDEGYAQAKEDVSGESKEPFVVLSPKKDETGRDKKKPSARVGSADRADKYP